MKIRVGSRESRLAVIQARMVMDRIREACPYIQLELVTMKTTGDKILDRTLDKIGGKGLFIKELDTALLNGVVDIAVHSYKDVPMETDERLPIVSVSKREDPRDVLILPQGVDTWDLKNSIGCSSARRRLQLMELFPGCGITPLRGNVLTRLEKLDRGEFSAIVLALAGLKRLELHERVSRIFEIEEVLPAACQGMIAVQARSGSDTSYLSAFHDSEAWDISIAERSFVRALDGGCSAPVAAYGTIDGDILTLIGLYVDASGRMYRGKTAGKRREGTWLGEQLARKVRMEAVAHAG